MSFAKFELHPLCHECNIVTCQHLLLCRDGILSFEPKLELLVGR